MKRIVVNSLVTDHSTHTERLCSTTRASVHTRHVREQMIIVQNVLFGSFSKEEHLKGI